MRPMSVRELHPLCYERGIEFDPAMVAGELSERARMVVGQPVWDGRSTAQELHERRAIKGVPGAGCRLV
jgi:hypothetical protein